MSRTFIVGAGFSKAVHSGMPTLHELGTDVLRALDLPADHLRPFGENLEEWLSYLAGDQPFLRDEDNLRHRALFLEVAEAIYKSMKDRELRAIRGGQPQTWLLRLVRAWAAETATVITFNYDELIERAITHQSLVSHWADLYAIPLSQRWPAGSSGFLSANPPPGPVPRIMKLHGSLGWRYGGVVAPVTEELFLSSGGGGWEAVEQRPPSPPRDSHLYRDKVPLIIPPTGSNRPTIPTSR